MAEKYLLFIIMQFLKEHTGFHRLGDMFKLLHVSSVQQPFTGLTLEYICSQLFPGRYQCPGHRETFRSNVIWVIINISLFVS